MDYYLYILECTNNSYYTGYTSDIDRRYHEHVAGSAKCKYTRSFPPQRLAACWKLESSRATVLSIERKIKKLSKSVKQTLIQNPRRLNQLLSLELKYTVVTAR